MTYRLTRNVEKSLQQLTVEGYEILSVSFGVNLWWIPTAFITVKREM